jgi:FkbM family methyltransferase
MFKRFIFKINKRWFINYQDVMSRRVSEGNLDLEELKAITKIIKKGDTVLDVGAHFGYYSLFLSNLVGRYGMVYAFEPSDRERKRLMMNIFINGIKNIKISDKAVSSSVGKSNLYVVQSKETGFNSMRKPLSVSPTKIKNIQTITLDKFIENSKLFGIRFVKIDVEGAELKVLKGANKLLSQYDKPSLLIEAEDLRTTPWGYKSKKIITLLVNKGYNCTYFCENKIHKVTSKEKIFHGNILAIPKHGKRLIK